MNSDRHIVHMDLDTFFVSCERLLDSRLNGKPVLIGGTSDRGVVASCSYEARTFGIHSAMPMRLAKQLCPEAIVLRGNSGVYSKFSNTVTDIIKESVPDCYADLGYKTVSTNPCGEIPLCPYDSCRLLAINLFSYVEKPFTKNASFNFELFKKHIGIAQRIMDDIIDL